MEASVGFVRLLLVGSLTGMMAAGEPVDVPLRDSRNSPTSLSRYRGKPTILFYENQGSVHQNDPFKHALAARGRAMNLLASAHVVAIADLHRYDFFPARSFALKAVRDAEAKSKIPVLVDWRGALSAPPWNLPHEASSVVVLDGYGRPVYAHSGQLGQREMEDAFQALAKLLNVDLSGAVGSRG